MTKIDFNGLFKWGGWIFAIILLFIIAYTPTGSFDVNINSKFNNERDSLTSVIITQHFAIREYKNREFYTNQIITSKANEIIQLRKILSDNKIQINDLNSYISLNINSSQSNTIPLTKDSTIKNDEPTFNKIFNFKDSTKNLLLKGSIDINKSLMSYTYKYSANYDIISYYKRKNIFTEKKLSLKIISDDPKSEINVKTFNIKQPKKIIDIGFGVGGSLIYLNKKLRFTPSIQISAYKPIISFYKK